jgi:hypothetical protein
MSKTFRGVADAGFSELVPLAAVRLEQARGTLGALDGRRGSKELEDRGVRLAAGLTHGLQPVLDVVIAHAVHKGRHDAGARGAEQVP